MPMTTYPVPSRRTDKRARRIAILFHGLSGGGMESSMLRLAAGFAARGHHVDVVIEHRDGEFADCVPAGVNVHEFNEKAYRKKYRWFYLPYMRHAGWAVLPFLFSWNFRSTRPLRPMSALPWLASYLETHRPDALLAAEPRYNLLAALTRHSTGVPTRIALSERVQPSIQAAENGPWGYRKLLPLFRWAYLSADAVIAVSHGVADDLAAVAGIPRQRISTVYNPVVGPDLATLAADAVDHPWFTPDAPPIILAAGRISPQKDFLTLVRAFAAVRRVRRVRLVILGAEGDGCADYLEELHSLVRELGVGDDVDFPGFAANPFAFMARAAVFVLSSRFEGLPGVLIQALACGCPVVSTDCPSGPREVLDGGRYGPLVPVGDSEAMTAAILRTLDAPLPPADLLARAALFSIDNAVDNYLRLLLGPTTSAPPLRAAAAAVPAGST